MRCTGSRASESGLSQAGALRCVPVQPGQGPEPAGPRPGSSLRAVSHGRTGPAGASASAGSGRQRLVLGPDRDRARRTASLSVAVSDSEPLDQTRSAAAAARASDAGRWVQLGPGGLGNWSLGPAGGPGGGGPAV
jgi:hypothetical protein